MVEDSGIVWVSRKNPNGKDVNQMRIENIAGCELLKKEESVDDVLVVYCAKHPAHTFTKLLDGSSCYVYSSVKRQYLVLKIYNITMQ